MKKGKKNGENRNMISLAWSNNTLQLKIWKPTFTVAYKINMEGTI